MSELVKLRNIGEKSAAWLEGIGVHSRADLEALGAAAAYRLIAEQQEATSANLLYALQGALEERDWRDFTAAEKETLLAAAEGISFAEGKEKLQPAAPVRTLTLALLPEVLAVCQLDGSTPLRIELPHEGFLSVTQTDEEVSIVMPEDQVQRGWRAERGWRCLRVNESLDFSLVGILAGLASTLAAAGVSIFTLSTFDTDYILVKGEKLEAARAALTEAGHVIIEA